MNNCTITSNKTNLQANGFTHVNLPIFSDSKVTQTIGCMEDIDIGRISSFGIKTDNYDPATYQIASWNDFVQKVHYMFEYVNSRIDAFGSNISSIKWESYSVSNTTIKVDGSVTLTLGYITPTYNDGSKGSIIPVEVNFLSIQNGRYEVKNNIVYLYPSTIGTMTISVVYQGVYAQQKIEVNVDAATIPVDSISLSPSTPISLTVGNTYNITALINPPTASNKNVNWRIDQTTNVATINATGNTATITASNPGTATIIATADGDTSKTASCSLTVTAKAVESVSISPTSGTLSGSSTNNSITLTALVSNISNPKYNWDMTGAGAKFNGSTSDQTVNVKYDNTSSNDQTANITCTVTGGSTPITSNTVKITCKGAPSVSINQNPEGNLTSTTEMTLTAQTKNLTNISSYIWSLEGSGAKLSSTTNQTVKLIYTYNDTDDSSVKVTCTVSGDEGEATTSKTIIIEGQKTQYKWAAAFFTKEEDDSDDYVNIWKTRLDDAWSKSNTYWTEKPSVFAIPPILSDYHAYVIIYDRRLGECKFKDKNGKELNNNVTPKEITDGKDYLGRELNYESTTKDYMDGGNTEFIIEWQ